MNEAKKTKSGTTIAKFSTPRGSPWPFVEATFTVEKGLLQASFSGIPNLICPKGVDLILRAVGKNEFIVTFDASRGPKP